MLAACYQLQGAPFQLRIYAPESASLKRSTLRGQRRRKFDGSFRVAHQGPGG